MLVCSNLTSSCHIIDKTRHVFLLKEKLQTVQQQHIKYQIEQNASFEKTRVCLALSGLTFKGWQCVISAKGSSSDSSHRAKLHRRRGPKLNSVSVQIYAPLPRPSVCFATSTRAAAPIPYMHPPTAKLCPTPNFAQFREILCQMHLPRKVGSRWLAGCFEWFNQQMASTWVARTDIYIKSLFREVSEHLWCDGKRERLYIKIFNYRRMII